MNKEELEKVEQLIEQKDSEQLKDLLAGLHPADIAELCNEPVRSGDTGEVRACQALAGKNACDEYLR